MARPVAQVHRYLLHHLAERDSILQNVEQVAHLQGAAFIKGFIETRNDRLLDFGAREPI